MAGLFMDEAILNMEKEEEHPNWCLYFDGVINVHGNGIKAISISPTGIHFPIAIKLRFPQTNNMAECWIVGLESVLDVNVKVPEVYEDFIMIIS